MTDIELLQKMDQKLDVLVQKVDALEKRVSALESDVRLVKITEEGINANMRIAAENQIDSYRTINTIAVTKAEKDLMNLRIRSIQDDVNVLKEKLDCAVAV